MKKSARKLELKSQTVAELTTRELEVAYGGNAVAGRSRTGNCPVETKPPPPG